MRIVMLALFIVLGGTMLFISTAPTKSVAMDKGDHLRTEKPEGYPVATFGGGCFWCTEAIFQDLNGVEKVMSGYSGGAISNPTYREVCSGRTGHAEVIQVTYDPSKIKYEDLLVVHLTTHNPTTMNRQGADKGTQYRSAIFYQNEEEKIIAEQTITRIQEYYNNPIVTEIAPLEMFYEADEYHQDYYKRNPAGGYCQGVIEPKLKKFRQQYATLLK